MFSVNQQKATEGVFTPNSSMNVVIGTIKKGTKLETTHNQWELQYKVMSKDWTALKGLMFSGGQYVTGGKTILQTPYPEQASKLFSVCLFIFNSFLSSGSQHWSLLVYEVIYSAG